MTHRILKQLNSMIKWTDFLVFVGDLSLQGLGLILVFNDFFNF